MSELIDWVKARVRCCSCEGSLQSSRYVNMVALLKEATWKYPVHGNILVYPKYPTNRAVAVLCDRCIDQRREPKYAVEWDKDRTQVEYHRVEGLKNLAPIPEEEIAKAEAELHEWSKTEEAKVMFRSAYKSLFGEEVKG